MQVRYLQEGSRVHKTELEWQGMKMQHRAQQELDAARARHAALEHALQTSMDDLTCAAPLLVVRAVLGPPDTRTAVRLAPR